MGSLDACFTGDHITSVNYCAYCGKKCEREPLEKYVNEDGENMRRKDCNRCGTVYSVGPFD